MHSFGEVATSFFPQACPSPTRHMGVERLSTCLNLMPQRYLLWLLFWQLLDTKASHPCAFATPGNALKVLGEHCKVTSCYFQIPSLNSSWLYSTHTNLACQEVSIWNCCSLFTFFTPLSYLTLWTETERESRARFDSVSTTRSTPQHQSTSQMPGQINDS